MYDQVQSFDRVVVDLAANGIREDFSSNIANSIKYEYDWKRYEDEYIHTVLYYVLKHRYTNHCYDLLRGD